MTGKDPLPPAEYVDEIQPEHLLDGHLSAVVFGPGRGEAILVKMPDGQVGVVDGCRRPNDPLTGEGDPVRELLEKLDIPKYEISFVALTHPHSDHYPGLSSLVDAWLTNSRRVRELWCPFHVGDRYAKAWFRYLKDQQRTGKGRSPHPKADDVRDLPFVSWAEIIRARQAKYLAISERKVLIDEMCQESPLRIQAVGPTDRDLFLALEELLDAIRHRCAGDERQRPTFDPNAASGALLLTWGEGRILLAGDLLAGNKSYDGWTGVSNFPSPVQIVNVAHHGSEEAHHPELWARMAPQLAIVTPFQFAKNNQPPKQEDITRLAGTGVAVAITTPPDWGNPGDPTLPQPQRPERLNDRRTTQRPRPGGPSLRSPRAIQGCKNAVSVSIDASGTVRRIVLAGQADFWK